MSAEGRVSSLLGWLLHSLLRGESLAFCVFCHYNLCLETRFQSRRAEPALSLLLLRLRAVTAPTSGGPAALRENASALPSPQSGTRRLFPPFLPSRAGGRGRCRPPWPPLSGGSAQGRGLRTASPCVQGPALPPLQRYCHEKVCLL